MNSSQEQTDILLKSSMEGSSDSMRDVRPPMASFTPSMWGDTFSTFSLDAQVQETYAKSMEALKIEVRKMLIEATCEKLIVLVDRVERLGLAYQFESEIKDKLHQIYMYQHQHFDLFTTALRFRLLRQHRFQVTCDDFVKFMDKEKNKFEEIHSGDVEGLLSLYEAAQVGILGESILEKAVTFTTNHLTSLEPQLETPLKERVKQALQQSLHRGVPIFHIHNYISTYQTDSTKNDVVLELAKLNFNFLRNLYRDELCQLSRWWNKFDLKSKLVYARDRIVECYLWGVAVHFEPQYSDIRIAFAKSMQLASIIDDTYDNYATLAEAQLLTQHLERWNMDDIDLLPDYMKIVYGFIMSVFEDYERDAAAQGKSFAVPYFRETVKQLGRAYNKEQIWIMEGQMPPFEEYITNSVITSCIYIMFTALVPAMKCATKQDIDWLLSEPKIVISTAKMGRHLQDLGSHERENREGKMLTVVDCYMKDHNVSKQEALSKFVQLVEDGWKNVNTEWAMRSSSAPKEFVELLLNYARVANVTFNNNVDGYTTPENNLAPQIVALLVL